MTHYTPGMGSCGITSTDGEDVVALSKDFMTYAGNPNSNPKCGSKISIWNPVTQMTFEATVGEWPPFSFSFPFSFPSSSLSFVLEIGGNRIYAHCVIVTVKKGKQGNANVCNSGHLRRMPEVRHRCLAEPV